VAAARQLSSETAGINKYGDKGHKALCPLSNRMRELGITTILRGETSFWHRVKLAART
jgi:hypothetical protein